MPVLLNDLDEETFQAVYGAWRPLLPAEVVTLLRRGTWYVAGGRAARVGAAAREHDDTDVVVRRCDLSAVRGHLRAGHRWEAHEGGLRPLLPDDDLTEGREQPWVRRDAASPWVLDLLLQPDADEWVFKKDSRVRVRWDRALHDVDGIAHLRPELALLHKAHLDRPKDRADLEAALLTPPARTWLVETLTLLGHDRWAVLTEQGS